MSLSTLRQHPFFLVLTLLTIIAFLDLCIHVQPTQAYNPQAIQQAIDRGLAAIGVALSAIALYLTTKKGLNEKIKDAKAEKSTIEGKIQAFDTEINTLNKERSKVDNERKSKYATIGRCDAVIDQYFEYTSPSHRALMQDKYDMAVADKKEAKKAIEKLDLRIDHYDLAITIAKNSKEKGVPPLEADLKKAQKKLSDLEGEKTTNQGLLEDANKRLGIEKSNVSSLEQELPLHENHAH